MDLLTQGILGAAASQAVFARKLPRSAWLIGAVAGFLADADVFIHPASDALGGLTYHRHFSHSLAFIPIGALVAAIPFLFLRSLRPRRKAVYFCALVGYATHAILDACTSYGTMLFWPFSDVRISWDLIAIIDPAFTLPLLIGVIISVWRRRPAAARVALCISIAYMFVGLVQRDRALDAQAELAAIRGHTLSRGRVIPTPLSLLLWRSVYTTTDGQIVADAVRTPYFSASTVLPGSSARLVTVEQIKREHADDPALIAAFEQFSWFTDGYTAEHEDEPTVIGDMRYCVEPQTFDSLWGFSLVTAVPPPPGSPGGVPQRMVSFRMTRGERMARVWQAILGNNPGFQTLATMRAGKP